MNKKFKKKKTIVADRQLEEAVVCEDIDNESEDVENSFNYEDKDQAGKRERIKQMGDPH